ncbi:hypothetical protein [Actinacidiphila acididurans]|uniref:hypothetical protein n=1 Tax=Actinacidiphila acididurans TaxID=2784346 RepID=UPI001F22474E|nr:hypothetical protein [Actinacidiphila acididurans]
MRIPRLLSAAAAAGAAALLALAGPAAADDPSATPSASASAGGSDTPPNEAGTNFLNATVLRQGQTGTASASAGDYLYWTFPADTGQHVTVNATVTFPAATPRHGASTWQVDVYDGLRRRQACRYGSQTRTAAADATSVALTCHLRAIRSWAEPWSNDPLRGAYYVRLTDLSLPPADLGLPVAASVQVTSDGTAGSQAVDGSVAPVVSANGPAVAPSGGWAGTWWSPRWLWTGGGGLLAALFAVGAHRLARGPVTRGGAGYRSDVPDSPREPAGWTS